MNRPSSRLPSADRNVSDSTDDRADRKEVKEFTLAVLTDWGSPSSDGDEELDPIDETDDLGPQDDSSDVWTKTWSSGPASSRSSVEILNNSTPRIDPWGTPP